MKRVFFALTLFALMLPNSAPAATASAPDVPLRHMVFGITIGIRTIASTQGSGIGTDGGSKASGSGVQGSGTITADVMAPTQDGGLIIKISEEAQDRKAPVVRVAVRMGGEILTPPDAHLLEEESMLLRYLARGIVAVATPAWRPRAGPSLGRPTAASSMTPRKSFRIKWISVREFVKKALAGLSRPPSPLWRTFARTSSPRRSRPRVR